MYLQHLKKLVVLFILVFTISSCAEKKQQTFAKLEGKILKSHQELVQSGAQWLAKQQRSTGAWGKFQPDIGITALAITALNRIDKEKYAQHIKKGVELILSRQNKGGANKGAFSDVDGKFLNYRTCVAIRALSEIDNEKYEEQIKMGQRFIKGLQFLDQSIKRDFGAIGYGSKIRGDLSNTQFALEALAETGVSPSDPVFKRSKIFLERLQNFKRGGDEKFFDGGFPYGIEDGGEGKSPKLEFSDELRYQSYGGMTYAGLKSMIYARIEPSDPRVQACWKWIQTHYTLDENPGLAPLNEPAKGQQGLYYYYHTFAKTMNLIGRYQIDLPYGKTIRWREDLINALSTRQKSEGYWVNDVSRWWEADPELVTTYSLLALTQIQ